MTVTRALVERAAETISGSVVRTPFLWSRTLSEIAGADLYIKFENLQYTASFKDRGALNKLVNLPADAAAAGVIAVSAGNHAQGVAYHGSRLGIAVTIVMPRHTPLTKIEYTRHHGARVVLEGDDLDAAAAAAHRIADAENLTFVHPFDDDLVIAGQGTVALEMLAEVPDLDDMVVPIGGGGLISGMAIAAKALRPAIRVTGVEAALYPAMREALAGRAAPVGGPTVAEGIAVKRVGERTLACVREWVDDLISVEEAEIEHAISLYLNVEKTVAEGAGAAALAAVLSHRARFRGRKVGLVLSGGNIDPRLLASVIMRELVRDGRIVRLRIQITDVPGALAAVTAVLGKAEANIIEVHHQRTFSDVSAKGADVDLVAEMRDAAHTREVVAALEAKGYSVRLLSGPAEPDRAQQGV